jgi:putative endonuclease
MHCYTYILYSQIQDRYYIGHTCDAIDERLRKHNANHKGYTGNSNDWKIVHFENFQSKKEAYQREREIKKRKSRTYIEQLIQK